MPAAKKHRVAVIGSTGKGNYGHGLDTVWLLSDRAEIVAVADDNDAGREAAVKRLKAPRGYADYREMLAKEKPGVVSICPRWLGSHREMVLACAAAGASMFLEKPLCPTLQEADEMVAACEKHHVACVIAHQTRYSPRVLRVKELIAEGRIGDVLEVNGHGKEDARGGGDDMMVLGTHTFDLMRMLVGDAKWCFARINANGKKAGPGDVKAGGEQMGPVVGDHIVATFGFDGLAVGHYQTHKAKAGAGKRYWLEIRGTKGLIHLGFGGLPTALLCEDPSWMPGASKAPWQEITSNGLGKPETIQAAAVGGNGNLWLAHDLLDCVETGRRPLGGIHDGRASLEMILAVYESHRLGRPVDLPLANRKHPLAG